MISAVANGTSLTLMGSDTTSQVANEVVGHHSTKPMFIATTGEKIVKNAPIPAPCSVGISHGVPDAS